MNQKPNNYVLHQYTWEKVSRYATNMLLMSILLLSLLIGSVFAREGIETEALSASASEGQAVPANAGIAIGTIGSGGAPWTLYANGTGGVGWGCD